MREIALGLVLTAVVAASARADEPAAGSVVGRLPADVSFMSAAPAQAPTESESKPFTISAGLDGPSDYYWRGMIQNFNGLDREGFVAQPFVDLGIAFSDAVSLNVGVWTSLHSGEATGTFYEADYYASLGFSAGRWAPAVTYTAYTSPNDSFSTVHEVALSVSFDDSDSALPLSPSALVGFFSDDAGTYFEAGIEPAIPTGGPLSLSIPIGIGLSLDDFYGDTFGFFKAGVGLGVDLGSGWEVHGGLDLLFLGESIRWDDGEVKPVPYVGFSYSY
jgi:uncharacterized protein (TIGR02001 family)